MKPQTSYLKALLIGATATLAIKASQVLAADEPLRTFPYWFGVAFGGALFGAGIAWLINRRRKV